MIMMRTLICVDGDGSPCLRLGKLFNGRMDGIPLIWNLGMIRTIENLSLHFDGLFVIKWTM